MTTTPGRVLRRRAEDRAPGGDSCFGGAHPHLHDVPGANELVAALRGALSVQWASMKQ